MTVKKRNFMDSNINLRLSLTSGGLTHTTDSPKNDASPLDEWLQERILQFALRHFQCIINWTLEGTPNSRFEMVLTDRLSGYKINVDVDCNYTRESTELYPNMLPISHGLATRFTRYLANRDVIEVAIRSFRIAQQEGAKTQ